MANDRHDRLKHAKKANANCDLNQAPNQREEFGQEADFNQVQSGAASKQEELINEANFKGKQS